MLAKNIRLKPGLSEYFLYEEHPVRNAIAVGRTFMNLVNGLGTQIVTPNKLESDADSGGYD